MDTQIKYYLTLFLGLFVIGFGLNAQSGWQTFTDVGTGVSFSMPPNVIAADTLLTRLYASEVDSTEAVQVHIFDDARFDTSDELFNEALTLENGDTLRVIARLILLLTDGELTALDEVYTNGIRGMELGTRYMLIDNDVYYYSFMRYYLVNGKFISFTWTGGEEAALRRGITAKELFFDSVQF